MGILDGTRSRAGGSGKRSLAERLEPYLSKSFSFKAVMCLGIAVSFLVILLLIAAFTGGSAPGVAGTETNGSSPTGSPSAGYASTSATTNSMNASNETGGITNGSMSYSDENERHNLTQTFNEMKPSPTAAPTPIVAPKLPLEVLWDQPFYESIKTIQDFDRKKLMMSDTSYRFDSGPLLIDPASTYGGSQYAYPGDSIGMRLQIYNNGKPLGSIVVVDISLLKLTDEKLQTYTDTGVDMHYDMRVDMDVNTRMEKNITINVPDESLRSPGYYRLCVKLYVNDTLSSDMSKDFNVL